MTQGHSTVCLNKLIVIVQAFPENFLSLSKTILIYEIYIKQVFHCYLRQNRVVITG